MKMAILSGRIDKIDFKSTEGEADVEQSQLRRVSKQVPSADTVSFWGLRAKVCSEV